MTPIKVRGKRHATKAEKWNAGKQRKHLRAGSTTSSEQSSSARSETSSVKKLSRRHHRQRIAELSKLEQLPTEVLQAIFELSTNIDLPLVSARLAVQLASSHLHHQLTSTNLRAVLDGREATSTELAAAMRLMDSKFFTWNFFSVWLNDEFERLGVLREWQDATGSTSSTMEPERQREWTWYKLQPHVGLLPPNKILRGPFTPDKVQFLKLMTSSYREDPESLAPSYKELAKEGVQQAVSEGAEETLPSFWTLGMQPDTELLRHAIIDSGCMKSVVQTLVTRILHLTSEPVNVDFLDPALWSWADKARSGGSEKGAWLMSLLKDAARISGRKDAEIQQAKAAVDDERSL